LTYLNYLKMMNSNKNKLLNYYNKTDLPTDLLTNDSLKHKDFLFNDISVRPNEGGDMSMAFVVEEKRKIKPGWRDKRPEEEVKPAVDNRFDNTMVEQTPVEVRPNINVVQTVTQTRSAVPILPFEPLKIENIFLADKKLNYPVGEVLWYTINPLTQRTHGPLSSMQIADQYQTRIVDGNWDFRPLDLFQFQSVGSLKFQKLTIINNDNWVNDIIDSQLLKYTELYKLSEIIIADNKLDVDNTIDLSIIRYTDNAIPIRHEPIKEAIKQQEPIKEIVKPGSTKELVKQQEPNNDQWEVIGKKKKTSKKEKEEFVLDVKKEVKKEEPKPNKFSSKVQLVSGEELVHNLKPKNSPKENQPKQVDLEDLGFHVEKKKKKI
jgi:hypothetical protein